MGQQKILGDIQRIRCRDSNADGFLCAHRLDSIDEAHRSATAGGVVLGNFARQAERDDAFGEADVENVLIRDVVHLAPAGQPRLASQCLSRAPVDHATQRANKECHILGKLQGRRPKLNSAGAVVLRHRTAVAVQQPLQNGKPHFWRVGEILERYEFVIRLRPRQRQPT